MNEITQLEQQIEHLLLKNIESDTFSMKLESLISARHHQVTLLLSDSNALTRSEFDQLVKQTKALKATLEKHKTHIREGLLKAKIRQQSASAYQTYQK